MNEMDEMSGTDEIDETRFIHSIHFTFQGRVEVTKDELHGFVVKLCTDEQLDAAINRHLDSYRCGRCNQPLGALLVNLGKSTHYDCN
jgi:hypothetical protein